MRIPMSPPPYRDILERLVLRDAPRFTLLLSQYAEPARLQNYLPWDELRHRQAPGDLTIDEWWAVTRMARQLMLRPLPLVDQLGQPLCYGLPDELLREVQFVETSLGARVGLRPEFARAGHRERFLIDSLIEEAITSSQLEGASTTRRVAQEMIRSGRRPRDRSERMILNGYQAMQRVGELRHEELTAELVNEIHRIVTDGTLDNPDSAGRFQLPSEERIRVQDDQGTVLLTPPPAAQLPERMQRLCNFANGGAESGYLPPVVRALTVHYMLAYEHPYEDGNGRTARALFYWSMLRQGYWMTEFVSISRILRTAPVQYARSYLYTQTDGNDLTYFLLHQLRVLHRAIDDFHRYLDRKLAELREVRWLLVDGAEDFNPRQLDLLNGAIRNLDQVYTLHSHQVSHGISLETARQDLYGLEAHGLLVREKVGRAFQFRPAPDLAAIRAGAPAGQS
jgi:Fic family protein